MSDKVHLFVDASKETDYALEGNFGIEYFPIKNLSVSGQRFLLLVSYKIASNLSLWARVSQTVYEQSSLVNSDEKLSDFKVILKYKL